MYTNLKVTTRQGSCKRSSVSFVVAHRGVYVSYSTDRKLLASVGFPVTSQTVYTMDSSTSVALEPLLSFPAFSLSKLEPGFYRIPDSAVVARYVKSSHQNDRGRTILELILVIFAIMTLLLSRTRTDRSSKHFIKFSEKVIGFHETPLLHP